MGPGDEYMKQVELFLYYYYSFPILIKYNYFFKASFFLSSSAAIHNSL